MRKVILIIYALVCYQAVFGQTITKNFKAKNKVIDHLYKFGCHPFNASDYNFTYSKTCAGFTSEGQGCITEHTYSVLSIIEHNGIQNKDIESIKLKFTIRKASLGNFPAVVRVIVPQSEASSSAKSIHDLLNYGTRYIIGDFTTESSAIEKTVTINNSSNPNLSIFNSNWEKFEIGFINHTDVVDLTYVSCDITYSCDLPNTPVSLSIEPVSTTKLDLSWDAVNGAKYYEIYSGTGSYPLHTTSGTSYSISGLSPGTNYSYRIKAKNDCGKSDFSSTINGTTLLATPASYRISCNSSSCITLSWNHVTGAEYYEIYTCSGSYVGRTSGSGTGYIVDNLSPGLNYSFKVRARKEVINSSFTSCKSITTIPEAPISVSANAVSHSSIEVNWNQIEGASSYKVYRCDGTHLKTVSSNSSTIYGLSPLTTYSFKVKAINSSGESSFSECCSARTKLKSPTSFEISTISATQLKLSWSPISESASYEIFNCSGELIATTSDTEYNITGLISGNRYEFKLRAVENEEISNFTSCKSARTTPPTPTNINTIPISDTKIKITWGRSDGSSNYKIYDCEGTLIGETSALEYTVSGLNQLTTHSFKVKATNIGGESDFSDCVSGTTLISPPQNVHYEAISESEIKVSWDKNTFAENYEIYYCHGTFIGSTSENQYIVSDLVHGTTVSFKLKANNGSSSSPYSQCLPYSSKPKVPEGITATAIDDKSIKLTWNQVNAAVEYEIYSCEGVKLASTTNRSYTISNLSHATNYSFKLRAKSSFVFGDYSACIDCSTSLAVPTGFEGESLSSSEVFLRWDKVEGVSTYEIMDCSGSVIKVVSGTSCTLSGLNDATLFAFSVRSKNGNEVSDNSDCLNVGTKLTIPSPQIMTVIQGRTVYQWSAIKGACDYDVFNYCGDKLYTTDKLYAEVGWGTYVKVRANHCNNIEMDSDFSDGLPGLRLPYQLSKEDINLDNYSLSNADILASQGQIMSATPLSECSFLYLIGKEVVLKPGFAVHSNSTFIATSREDQRNKNVMIYNEQATANNGTLKQDIEVYPNPTNSIVNITISNTDLKGVNHIEVFDLLGNKILKLDNVNYSNSIDLSKLHSGVYFVVVYLDGSILKYKIMKK